MSTTPYTPMRSKDGALLLLPNGTFTRFADLPVYQPAQVASTAVAVPAPVAATPAPTPAPTAAPTVAPTTTQKTTTKE